MPIALFLTYMCHTPILFLILSLSEKQLSELLIILGNKYTGVYSRKVYKNGHAKLPKALWTKLPRGVERNDSDAGGDGGGEGDTILCFTLLYSNTHILRLYTL